MFFCKNASHSVLALLLAMQCGALLPADASKGGPQVNAAKASEGDIAGLITIAHIPVSSELLAVVAENAQVKINRSSKVTDIIVATNHPKDWNVSGATIRQAGMIKARGGVAMLADKLGSRCIVNGKIYPLPPGPIQGGISLSKDGVSVGGKKIEPIQGIDMPGISSGSEGSSTDAGGAKLAQSTAGAVDQLEILVPDNYAGSLKIGAASDSQIELGSWNGGTIEVYMMGQGTLTAGKLDALAKAVVDVNGTGKADIQDLSTKIFVANVNGSGKVNVLRGSAEMSNATIAGDGVITLKGSYKNLKQAVQGQGTISVTN